MDWTNYWYIFCASLPTGSRIACVCLFLHLTLSLIAQWQPLLGESSDQYLHVLHSTHTPLGVSTQDDQDTDTCASVLSCTEWGAGPPSVLQTYDRPTRPLKQVSANLVLFQDWDCILWISTESWCVLGWVSLSGNAGESVGNFLYFRLRRISKICSFLTVDTAKILAVAFILSLLDYCNSLLPGLSDRKLAKL